MKAILIDAKNREIREVEYRTNASTARDVPTIGDLVGGWIDTGFRWQNGDVMYVDDEGLLKPSMHFFFCRFRPDQPMAGNGVIVGREVEDDSVPGGFFTEGPEATVEWLREQIIWMDRADFDRWALANSREPAMSITTTDEQGNVYTEIIATYEQLHKAMPRDDGTDPETGEEKK